MKEEEVASVKAEQCQEIKESAEKDLAEALPALDAAVAVLRNLKLSDLSEVAKYTNPPAGCKLTMEAMCVLKQAQSTSTRPWTGEPRTGPRIQAQRACACY